MNQQAINSAIKRELASYAKNKDTSTWNKDVWALAGIILTESAKDVKAARMEERAKVRVRPAEKPSGGGGEALSERMQHYMDNPMTPENEAKGLRAMLHVGIESGEIPAPLLDRLDKIIGVSNGEDTEIQVVDWSTAFPDIATAIEICSKPSPIDLSGAK